MAFPKKLLAKLIARFDELISSGESILAAKVHHPTEYSRSATTFDGEPAVARHAYDSIDGEKFIAYRTSVATLLGSVIPEGHVHFDAVRRIAQIRPEPDGVRYLNSLLRGIKEDLNMGFLDDVADSIEAEISSDYLTQAEGLLNEGKPGNFDHVPAAVLAGAILERALRSLCDKQTPPIATKTAAGEPKTLNPLIDDLKKASVFNELKAKQLRAWADVRNKAAHGEFQSFNRGDVETMISGITGFLADYS
jgi:hypothetical protein